MKNLKVGLTAKGKTLTGMKILWEIFQGDALSPLLFVIVMMPLNHIIGKCTVDNKFTNSQEKHNHLMYMDDIKMFAKNETELKFLLQIIRTLA